MLPLSKGECTMYRRFLGIALALCIAGSPALAQDAKKPAPARPAPTVANLAYGKHERQVLDFWKAKSEVPAPLVLFIHGGGWQGGDKSGLSGGAIQQYLDAGISVAAINYRYVKQAVGIKIQPPAQAPLQDAPRALQLLPSK